MLRKRPRFCSAASAFMCHEPNSTVWDATKQKSVEITQK
jgi:hypothetical protein